MIGLPSWCTRIDHAQRQTVYVLYIDNFTGLLLFTFYLIIYYLFISVYFIIRRPFAIYLYPQYLIVVFYLIIYPLYVVIRCSLERGVEFCCVLIFYSCSFVCD